MNQNKNMYDTLFEKIASIFRTNEGILNNKELFHFSYQRYLINCFRNNFGLEGTPVRLIVREKGEKE